MEFFQTIWTALTTENEMLTGLLCNPLTFIEAIVTMLLFTSILNIQSSFKQKLCYVISISLFGMLSYFIIPDPYRVIVNFIFFITTTIKIFHVSFLKAIIAQIFPSIIYVLVGSLLSKICIDTFNIKYEILNSVPICRISFMLSTYIALFIIYEIIKRVKINLNMLENMDSKSKLLLYINFILLFISISIQLYLVTFYSDTLPIIITIFSIISLITYFIISMYNLSRTTQLQVANQNLEEEKLYNKTLVILHDNIRGFKHDFNNIVSSIGGYVASEDMEGLKSYYSQLLEDCQKVNNLTILSPTVINNSAIYRLLSSKYHQAN